MYIYQIYQAVTDFSKILSFTKNTLFAKSHSAWHVKVGFPLSNLNSWYSDVLERVEYLCVFNLKEKLTVVG